MTLTCLKKINSFIAAPWKILLVAVFTTGSLAMAHPDTELTSMDAVFVSAVKSSASFLANSLKHGQNPGKENAEAIRSYGSYMTIIMVGIIGFLVIFRGREIRRQHPKSFR